MIIWDSQCPTHANRIPPMEEPKLNNLLTELKINQAIAKCDHYEAMTRLDARSRWMGGVVIANCVLLAILAVKTFIQ